MKKSIIAGAGVAALAMAALPFAGVFAATTTIVDNISVGVASSCQIGTNGDGEQSVSRSFAATNQQPGALVTFTDTEQATQVAIKCNASNGYTLTPTFTALTNATSDSIGYDGTKVAAGGDGKWSASYVLTHEDTPGSSTLMTSNSAITGSSTMTDVYNFTYNIGLSDDQPTGTYTGTATYLLAGQ